MRSEGDESVGGSIGSEHPIDYSEMYADIDNTIEEIQGMSDHDLHAEFARLIARGEDPADRFGRFRFRMSTAFGEIERRRIKPELEAMTEDELRAEMERLGDEIVGEELPNMNIEARFSALSAEQNRRYLQRRGRE